MSAAAVGFVQAALLLGLDSILVKPKRGLGPFTMQVVVEEIHTDELEITDHPVEQGALITDHSFKRPALVVIRGGWSDSPTVSGLFSGLVAGIGGTLGGLQSLITGNNVSQVRETYQKLLELQASRVPFDVLTGKRKYTDMLIQSLAQTTDRDHENDLFVTVTLRQVLIVRTEFTAAAPVARQADAAATSGVTNQGVRRASAGADFTPPATGAPGP